MLRVEACNLPSKHDEYYTPPYAIKPLIKYLMPKSAIWCPFDTDQSYYVRVFNKYGFDTINTHIDCGQDFFDLCIPECDYIISNPPYSKINTTLERLFYISIPFAMLINGSAIFDNKKRFDILERNKFELLYLYPRVQYFNNYSKPKEVAKSPPFHSAYLCSGILPKQICFEKITRC